MTNAFRLAALLVGLGTFGHSAAAQEALDLEREQEVELLQARVDNFFRSLTDPELGPERAMRELIAIGNGPLKDRTEEIAKLIEQAAALDLRYGLYTGHEAVSVKPVGSDLIFLRYLYKAERFPIVWCFTFYRAAPIVGVQREWSLISIKFDAKVEVLEK
ncbi:MAG: hypothetical protein WD872_16230 [Pirellulaceae bacterium]